VNSALQRARATLEERDVSTDAPSDPMDDEQQDLLKRYMDAFERYDMDALTALLHEDATLSMPPYELWLTGHDDIVSWMMGPGHACDGSRLVPVAANGSIAFGQYRASGPNGEHEPWGLVVIETKDGALLIDTIDVDATVTAVDAGAHKITITTPGSLPCTNFKRSPLEPVAVPAHGQEVPRLLGVQLQLDAQGPDEVVHRAGRALVLRSPAARKDVLPAQGAPADLNLLDKAVWPRGAARAGTGSMSLAATPPSHSPISSSIRPGQQASMSSGGSASRTST